MNVVYCLTCILYLIMQIYCIFPDNGELSSKCRIYFASSPNLPSYVSMYCPSVVKKAELVFSAIFRIGHGLNYFLKVMDIIVIAMIAAHSKQLEMEINSINDLPDWVVYFSFIAISLRNMSGG